MGLDMYAYTINASLVDDKPDTDVDVSHIARNAVGFVHLNDEQYAALSKADQLAYYRSRSYASEKAKEFGIYDSDFDYWRKFNHLHGWMESLYLRKGGTEETFNCNTVRIRAEDLDVLESLATLKAIPATEGFFFGSGEPFSDDDKHKVLQFVSKARAAITNGKAVFYYSWW